MSPHLQLIAAELGGGVRVLAVERAAGGVHPLDHEMGRTRPAAGALCAKEGGENIRIAFGERETKTAFNITLGQNVKL